MPVPEKPKSSSGRVTWHQRWKALRVPGAYSFYHIARALLNGGFTAVLLATHQPGLIGAANAAPSLGHTVGGVLFATKKDPHASHKLHRTAILGLIGQAIPTTAVAAIFAFCGQLNFAVAAIVVVGGGILAGILKAPVASVIYPLAMRHAPELSVLESTALVSNGMILGSLVGPLFVTLLVSTIGPGWLLPVSVLALICCGAVLPRGRGQTEPQQ